MSDDDLNTSSGKMMLYRGNYILFLLYTIFVIYFSEPFDSLGITRQRCCGFYNGNTKTIAIFIQQRNIITNFKHWNKK